MASKMSLTALVAGLGGDAKEIKSLFGWVGAIFANAKTAPARGPLAQALADLWDKARKANVASIATCTAATISPASRGFTSTRSPSGRTLTLAMVGFARFGWLVGWFVSLSPCGGTR